jgi:serine/threonine protein kinase
LLQARKHLVSAVVWSFLPAIPLFLAERRFRIAGRRRGAHGHKSPDNTAPGTKGLEIAQQLCAGLAAAHEKGVWHRDLKPANVMIDGRRQARITDFGLARLVFLPI